MTETNDLFDLTGKVAVVTGGSRAWDMDAFDERAETSIPLRRGGEAGEIVGAALYLASAASSYTTGSIIKVDGGSAWAPA